ncbi:MAG: NifB/NifX family molybdenum-iron cluster-binding protein [Erysipelotrichaceae bacterium]|nr:NifB/NifX family molybdenum-iron cluster-binding protein [Erysipelotrichaceae bacterium]
MRIAVTYDNGMIFQHFGRTTEFKVYDVQDGAIVNEQVIDTNGRGHGALAGVLLEAQADVLICGGIGMGAQMALRDAGIKLYPGVQGSADAAAKAFVEGQLDYDPDAHCDHHEHHTGGCGHHQCH